MGCGRPARHAAAPLAAALLALIAFARSAAAASSVPVATEPAPPRPPLHRCDLGMPRPFRCGHIMVPMLRADPALGPTKVAFAIRPRRDASRPSLGTILAMDGGPGYASTASPTPRSLIAALGPLLRRRDLVLYDDARHRPLRRGRLPGAAERA